MSKHLLKHTATKFVSNYCAPDGEARRISIEFSGGSWKALAQRARSLQMMPSDYVKRNILSILTHGTEFMKIRREIANLKMELTSSHTELLQTVKCMNKNTCNDHKAQVVEDEHVREIL